MAPRRFERPTRIALLEGPDPSLALEGLHVPLAGGARGGAVIAPPHPVYGGSMDSPVVTEVAQACEAAELESLRFNWRGVGASAGEVSGDPSLGAADYAAALDWIEESVEGPIVACGYSFGAATAVRAAVGRTRVQRLLLVAPPPGMLDRERLESFSGAVDVLVGDRDEFAPLADLQSLLAAMPNSRLEVLPECDHFFMTGRLEVGKVARSCLVRGNFS
jgi:alpha/beta superfamily hydrolase